MELDAVQRLETRSRLTSIDGGLYRPVTVDHVTTVERVAARLGEKVDFIHEVALEMDTGSRR